MNADGLLCEGLRTREPLATRKSLKLKLIFRRFDPTGKVQFPANSVITGKQARSQKTKQRATEHSRDNPENGRGHKEKFVNEGAIQLQQ